MKRIMAGLAVVVVSLLVSACTDKLTYCDFDDTVIKYESTDKYAMALGRKGIYVLRGKFRIYGKEGTAGQMLGYTGVCEYPIAKLIERYPHTVDPEVKELAEKQAARLRKKRKDESEIPGVNGSGMVVRTASDEDSGRDCCGKRHPVQQRTQSGKKVSTRAEGQNQ